MTSQQIALIRGINVGPSKRVAMADLRDLLQNLGFSNVKTLLNSGNVVFTSAEPDSAVASRLIEAELLARIGISARTIVLGADELAVILQENPLAGKTADPTRQLVAVFSCPEDRATIAQLEGQDWYPEILAVGSRAAYLWCPEGVIASHLSAAVNKLLGDRVTSRSWMTMQKLANLVL